MELDPLAQELDVDEDKKQPSHDEVEQLEERGHAAADTKEEEDLEQEEESEKVGDVSRFGEVSALVRDVLEHGELADLDREVGLSEREKAALVVLQEVVEGTAGDERIIYAEERLEMLNLAIAALQPALATGLDPQLQELRDDYQVIVDELQELREHLNRLVEAQEEPEVEEGEEQGSDQDDDDKPDAQGEPDAKSDTQHATFWQKVARKFSGKKPSGSGAPDPGAKPDPELGIPARESTLFGKADEPAVEDEPAGPSTVWDGEPGAR